MHCWEQLQNYDYYVVACGLTFSPFPGILYLVGILLIFKFFASSLRDLKPSVAGNLIIQSYKLCVMGKPWRLASQGWSPSPETACPIYLSSTCCCLFQSGYCNISIQSIMLVRCWQAFPFFSRISLPIWKDAGFSQTLTMKYLARGILLTKKGLVAYRHWFLSRLVQ